MAINQKPHRGGTATFIETILSGDHRRTLCHSMFIVKGKCQHFLPYVQLVYAHLFFLLTFSLFFLINTDCSQRLLRCNYDFETRYYPSPAPKRNSGTPAKKRSVVGSQIIRSHGGFPANYPPRSGLAGKSRGGRTQPWGCNPENTPGNHLRT